MSAASGVEIERKFLVDLPKLCAALPAALGAYQHRRIEQGYLAVEDSHEVRLRRVQRGAELLYLQTAKSGSGLMRKERERPVSAEFFAAFWELTEGRRVVKARYSLDGVIPPQALVLDCYEERLAGLSLAEIEFPSEADARGFLPPAWLGKEVTDDRRYGARSLALGGPLPPFQPDGM